jgi:hypothetical protein
VAPKAKGKAKPETRKAMEARHIETLSAAWRKILGSTPQAAGTNARYDYRKVRAAVYAVVPGRQKARNIRTLLDAGVKAAARAIVTGFHRP